MWTKLVSFDDKLLSGNIVTVFQTAVMWKLWPFFGWERRQMGENQWKTTFRDFFFFLLLLIFNWCTVGLQYYVLLFFIIEILRLILRENSAAIRTVPWGIEFFYCQSYSNGFKNIVKVIYEWTVIDPFTVSYTCLLWFISLFVIICLSVYSPMTWWWLIHWALLWAR